MKKQKVTTGDYEHSMYPDGLHRIALAKHVKKSANVDLNPIFVI